MMKDKKCIVMLSLWLTMFCGFAKKQPQLLLVEEVQGKVEMVTKQGKQMLNKGEILSEDAVLNVPFNGSVTLLDKDSHKQYIIKMPGHASVRAMLQDQRNTVLERTKDYVSHVWAQLRKETKIASRRSSDPATVTRDSVNYVMLDSVQADK